MGERGEGDGQLVGDLEGEGERDERERQEAGADRQPAEAPAFVQRATPPPAGHVGGGDEPEHDEGPDLPLERVGDELPPGVAAEREGGEGPAVGQGGGGVGEHAEPEEGGEKHAGAERDLGQRAHGVAPHEVGHDHDEGEGAGHPPPAVGREQPGWPVAGGVLEPQHRPLEGAGRDPAPDGGDGEDPGHRVAGPAEQHVGDQAVDHRVAQVDEEVPLVGRPVGPGHREEDHRQHGEGPGGAEHAESGGGMPAAAPDVHVSGDRLHAGSVPDRVHGCQDRSTPAARATRRRRPPARGCRARPPCTGAARSGRGRPARRRRSTPDRSTGGWRGWCGPPTPRHPSSGPARPTPRRGCRRWPAGRRWCRSRPCRRPAPATRTSRC